MEKSNTMKIRLSLLAFLLAAVSLGAQVRPGIEVLRDRDFAGLKGKKVGLVTNPSGIDRNLRSTIDILAAAPGVELKALFAPEHGVRGDAYAGDLNKLTISRLTLMVARGGSAILRISLSSIETIHLS